VRQISEFPAALLTLLGIQDMGETPKALSESVVLTIDSLQLYALNRRETIAAGSFQTVTAIGGLNITDPQFTVPNSERWYVWHYQIIGACAVGDVLKIQASCNFSPAANIALSPRFDALAGEQVRPFALAPFWANPGSAFGAIIGAFTGTPAVLPGAVITRFRL